MPRRFFRHHAVHPARRKGGLALCSWRIVVGLGVLVALFGAGYLAQINAVAAKGYAIRSLESEVAELKDHQEKLELKVAQEQAVSSVDRKVQEMGMVPTPKVDYVIATVPTVAKR